MDAAAIKGNSFVDAAQAAKTGAGAEQIMADFSAAVAERMNKSGQLTSKTGGKNGLVGHLKVTTDVQPEPQPEAQARAPQESRDNASEPRYDNGDADRQHEAANNDYRDAPAHDAPARDDTPRDTKPTEHSDAPRESAPESTSSDNQSQAGDDGEATAQNTQSSEPTETTTPDQAAAAQVAAAQVAQVTTKGPAEKSAETVGEVAKTVANPDAKSDASAKKQNASGNQNAQRDTHQAAQKADGNGEVTTPGVKDGESKTKSQAQAQNAQNTHLKADTAQGGDKGASVAQQQAQDLSKKVGNDKPLNVNVTVTKESESLTSKPSGSLLDQSSTKTQGESLTPTVAKPATKSQAQNGANPNAQAGKDAQVVTPQTDALQAAQAQKAMAQAKIDGGGVDTKAQSLQSASSTAQVAKAGGAEGATPTQTANPTASTQNTQQANAPKQAQHAQNAQTRHEVTEQVKVQINKALNDGVDRIRIQLKPAHLGRVDVQMEMTHDGRVSAVISADNKDTLDLLKQDSRELERALREAGLDLNSGDLSFNLRGQGGSASQQSEDGRPSMAKALKEPSLEELLDVQPQHKNIISEDRVDITA